MSFLRPLPAIAFAAALGLLAAPAAPAQVRVTMKANTSEVSIASEFQVYVILEGASGEVETPTLAGEGFEVLDQTAQQSSNISLFNGRRQRQSTVTFIFRLRPTRAGTIEVLPATVKAGGQSLTAQEGVKVEVQPIQPQDHLILEIEGPGKGVYVDQEFTITLKVFARRLSGRFRDTEPFPPRGGPWPRLVIPWFQGQEGFASEDFQKYASALVDPSGTGGFPINDYKKQDFFDRVPFRFQLQRTEAVRKGSDGRDTPYFLYTLSKKFRAQKTGSFLFGGVLAKDGYIFVDQGSEARPVSIIAQSPPLEITVKTPPEEGRPPSFTGGVGRFSISAEVKPVKVSVGQPLTLTLTVQGDGPLEGVGPPPLATQEGMDTLFRIHEEPTAGVTDAQRRTKTFTYGIRAKSAQVKAIPPLSFSSFDPVEEKYVTLKTPALPIQVQEAKANGSVAEFYEPVRRGTEKSEVQLLDQTPFALREPYEDADSLRPAEPPALFGAVHAAFLAVPPLVSLAFLGIVWRGRRLRADPALVRARRAHRQAARILAEASAALARDDGPGVHSALARAVARLVGDRLNLPPAGMTAADVRQALASAGAEEALAEETAKVFERADGARYGTAKESGEALRKRVEEAAELLKRLKASLSSSRGRR